VGWNNNNQWGYKCCKQTIKNSYCTGLAGIEAAEASADLMKANMARKEAAEGIFRENFGLHVCR
jgi:pre-mRNA-processing factor SLU7